MPVGLEEPKELLPVEGIRWGVAQAGIRYQKRDDLALMEICGGAHTAAVFTRNAFCAAPVNLARKHLAMGLPRHLLVNSGNANAGTGDQGMADAITCCEAVGRECKHSLHEILPFSTGVIGEPLPVKPITGAIPQAISNLSPNGWLPAARAIMTTDTLPKGFSTRFNLNGVTCTLTGIAKGAGMIRPDMATMLAYLATDAQVAQAPLQRCLEQAVASSFNRVTVDGDSSTNDACVLVATGKREGTAIEQPHGDLYSALLEAVTDLCSRLAQSLVRDGEGATRFVTIKVSEGGDEAECIEVAYTVAHSPLVKTALFAGDPNWGRILAAVGRARVQGLDIDQVRIYLGDLCIVESGGRAEGYSEEKGQRIMEREEITIRIALGRGTAVATVWTSDLSYDYVKINAEYRT